MTNDNEKYANKYRIESARATWHDYNGGMFFVTICTKNMEHYFGRIDNEPKMQLSEIGKYTDECIQKMETLHDGVHVPLYVVMPNHIHAIIMIDGTPIVETPYYDVSTTTTTTTTTTTGNKNEKMQQIANHCGKLSHVISRFKFAVTKYARENAIDFAWQTRFHDHIIRNNDELNRIAQYIENNVVKWYDDKLNNNENIVGTQNVGTQNVGTQNVGMQNVGMQNMGTQNVGTQNVGTQNVGTQNVGTQNVGTQNVETPYYDVSTTTTTTTTTTKQQQNKNKTKYNNNGQ